jgi:hypothetical protein
MDTTETMVKALIFIMDKWAEILGFIFAFFLFDYLAKILAELRKINARTEERVHNISKELELPDFLTKKD